MTDELPSYLNINDPKEYFHDKNSVFEYFTINEYTNLCANNQFKLLNFNILSLNPNKTKFKAFLSSVNSYHSFLILSETWINPYSIDISNID